MVPLNSFVFQTVEPIQMETNLVPSPFVLLLL